MSRLELAFVLLVVSLPFGASAESGRQAVSSGSEVAFLAKITGGSFTAKSEQVSGSLGVDKERKHLSASVAVAAASFSTGLGMRDNHMRDKYLEAATFKEIVFVAPEQEVAMKAGETSRIKGTLTVKGVSQPVEVEVRFESVTDSGVTATARFPIDITKFGIPQPSFAVVKMDPIVDATVRLVVKLEE